MRASTLSVVMDGFTDPRPVDDAQNNADANSTVSTHPEAATVGTQFRGRAPAFFVAIFAFSIMAAILGTALAIASISALPFIVAVEYIWECLSRKSIAPVDYAFHLFTGFGVILAKAAAAFSICFGTMIGIAVCFRSVRKRGEGCGRRLRERFSRTENNIHSRLYKLSTYIIQQLLVATAMLHVGIWANWWWDQPLTLSPMTDLVVQMPFRSAICTILGFVLSGTLLGRLMRSKFRAVDSQHPSTSALLAETANNESQAGVETKGMVIENTPAMSNMV